MTTIYFTRSTVIIQRNTRFLLGLLCLLLSSISLSAQDYNIGFKIVDGITREPIIGATVHNDDYTASGITDGKGYVFLEGTSYRDSVNIQYIGYITKKLTVKQILIANKFIKMEKEVITLGTAVVVGKVGRTDAEIEEIPYDVKQISSKEIKVKNPATTADALEKLGGAYVQRSQLGGGSPILRGFEASRVLLVVDGVRLNNAIYRSGHLQNAITLDNSILDQIEVIYGPGSITYGSDALGGVVHFRTRDPKLNRTDQSHLSDLNIYGRFSTATFEKTGHIDLNYGYKKWAFLTSASVSVFESLRAGTNRTPEYEGFGYRDFFVQIAGVDQVRRNPNPAILEDSGYNQVDLLEKIRFQPSDNTYFIGNFQYSTSSDVPRYDRLVDTLSRADDLRFAEWFYGPQERVLASIKGRFLNPTPIYDKSTIIASFQNINEDRNTREFSDIVRRRQDENVKIQSYTGDFEKYLDSNELNKLTYGVDANFNTVTSVASRIRIAEGSIALNEGLTRYPSAGSTFNTFGGYLGYRWKSPDDRFNLQGGARYSSVNIGLQYREDDEINWPQEFIDGVTYQNNNLTWGFGGGFRTKGNFHIKANIAKAFRSPNIDDFARIRVRRRTRIAVPNFDLVPETSINQELTIAKSFGTLNTAENTGSLLRLSATGYITNLDDAIVQVDGPLITESGEINVITADNGDMLTTQIRTNAQSAQIRGLNFNFNYNLRNKLIFEGGMHFTKGTSSFTNEFVQDTIVPFSHIPPTYGDLGLTYKTKKFHLEGQLRFNGTKAIEDYAISDIDANGVVDRVGTSDNLDFTPWELDENGDVSYLGSTSWAIFNVYTKWQFHEKLSLNIALENVFDKFYVPFSSSIAAPGRNLIISLNGNF